MAPKWTYQAELIAACNCEWGCPCNFNAKPSHGFCEGAYGIRIIRGVCGDTRLDGLCFAYGVKVPGAVHEGGGTARVWIDETASAEQRNAIDSIVHGKFDGLPWRILSSTIDNWLETACVPFEWHYDGPHSRYTAGTHIQVTLDYMRNLVTGKEATAAIVLPNGFVAKRLEATSTKTFGVFRPGLKFAAPGKYGFYTVTEHGN
jgi:hypothetical protein